MQEFMILLKKLYQTIVNINVKSKEIVLLFKMSQENSLTAPSDRDRSIPWKPDQNSPPLTDDQVSNAMNELNNKTFTDKFPSIERAYADPPIPMQNIALFSFTPAKGSTPNESGVYGFGKIRGVFNTTIEADERAEFIIRNVDSYHQVFHTYNGRPFPLTTSSKYSAETSEIDIRKEMTKSVSNNVKTKKAEEEKVIREIQEREEELINDSKTEPEDKDPYDEYITLNVKKAQLSWTYLEHIKKIQEIRTIIEKTRVNIINLDEKNPEFSKNYYKKYMDARKSSGFDDSKDDSNFLRFMVQDEPLPGIDNTFVLSPPNEKESTSTPEASSSTTEVSSSTPEESQSPSKEYIQMESNPMANQ